ncbi:uncharacterized protein LTR77_006879 [Saxophila tyrrhenica]|uniref:Uncharacterized protein n=1 Tax=Saxophila tyrrhenica TaxID=1690608 RepID=A0AAV9P908_9PEZI|nr:hypothetical protein LTR77_006879 [Saxophila tyrrhenica]
MSCPPSDDDIQEAARHFKASALRSEPDSLPTKPERITVGFERKSCAGIGYVKMDASGGEQKVPFCDRIALRRRWCL